MQPPFKKADFALLYINRKKNKKIIGLLCLFLTKFVANCKIKEERLLLERMWGYPTERRTKNEMY